MNTPELPPFDHQPNKYKGPPADEVLAQRKQFLNPGIFLYYKKPLMMVEGKMQYVWDEKGRRYLDALGGIVTFILLKVIAATIGLRVHAEHEHVGLDLSEHGENAYNG